MSDRTILLLGMFIGAMGGMIAGLLVGLYEAPDVEHAGDCPVDPVAVCEGPAPPAEPTVFKRSNTPFVITDRHGLAIQHCKIWYSEGNLIFQYMCTADGLAGLQLMLSDARETRIVEGVDGHTSVEYIQ